jgi:Flp pilus assembly pilin Flp
MVKLLRRLVACDSGQDLIEVALLVSLISLTGILVLILLGDRIMITWWRLYVPLA